MNVPVFCSQCRHHFEIPSMNGKDIDETVRILRDARCPKCDAGPDDVMFVKPPEESDERR